MRALTITLLLSGLLRVLHGQSLTEIEQKIRLIKTPQNITYDTTGFFQLPKFISECDDHFKAYDFPKDKTKWAYYHVIDLNQDGLKDVIYSGPCLPYNQTSMFLNDGISLKRIFDYAGKVVAIKQSSHKSVITIFKESCCCDCNSDLVEVTVGGDSRVEENWITFNGNTEIAFDQIERVKITGVLRTSPEVNDIEFEDNCTDRSFKGNHLTYIQKETNVIQLSKRGPWRLILYPDPENKTYSWLGWIMSK